MFVLVAGPVWLEILICLSYVLSVCVVVLSVLCMASFVYHDFWAVMQNCVY